MSQPPQASKTHRNPGGGGSRRLKKMRLLLSTDTDATAPDVSFLSRSSPLRSGPQKANHAGLAEISSEGPKPCRSRAPRAKPALCSYAERRQIESLWRHSESLQ